jgi:hypothetical protein
MPRDYYARLSADYQARRDRLCSALLEVGFDLEPPQGAYYVMADITAFGATDDVAFSRHLVRDLGVATVPGSSFFHDKALGRQYIRFCFCKRDSDTTHGHRAAEEAPGHRLIRIARIQDARFDLDGDRRGATEVGASRWGDSGGRTRRNQNVPPRLRRGARSPSSRGLEGEGPWRPGPSNWNRRGPGERGFVTSRRPAPSPLRPTHRPPRCGGVDLR